MKKSEFAGLLTSGFRTARLAGFGPAIRESYRLNLASTWGAQPYKGLVYFNDVNSGLWIVKLGPKIEKGSTTAPGQ